MLRYEKYVSAPAAWIGTLPSHWEVKKIGALFTERKTKVSDKDYAPLSVAKIGIVPQLETAVKTDAGDNRKLVRAGDFVINSRSDRKGSCGVSPLDGSVSLINIVLTPRDAWNSRYVHYLMRCHVFSEEYYRYGRGIVADLWTTRFSEMKNILLPIPPRTEQDQIVRYLDWKVSEINKLIALKKKEIRLILERQHTAISDLVFGRTINGKKKIIKALHNIEVPETWLVLRNKNLFRERTEHTETGSEMLLSVSRHYGVKPYEALDANEQYATIKPALSLVGYKKVYHDDLAMNIMRAQNGSLGISLYDGIVSPAYCIYMPIKDFDRMYIHFLYRTPEMIHAFSANSYGIVEHRRRLYPENFLRMATFLPPLNVQHEIVLEIEKTIDQFKKGILVLEKQISTLQEFKTRIVTDVVTGRVDVRGTTIPDYDFISDEPDCTDEDEDTDEDTENQED